MSAQIIDGKEISQAVRDEVAQDVEELQGRRRRALPRRHAGGREPGVEGVRRDEGEEMRRGRHRGMSISASPRIPRRRRSWRSSTRGMTIPSIHGILVQLPLPDHVDEKTVMERIRPEKDADGFHPGERGAPGQRRPECLPPVHARRRPGDAEAHRVRSRREARRDRRTIQYRGPPHGRDSLAEGALGQRHGDHGPQSLAGPRGDHPVSPIS